MRIMPKIPTLMLNVAHVINFTLLITCLNLSASSQDFKEEFDILEKLEDHYKMCLTSREVNPRMASLSSLLSALKSPSADSLSFHAKIKNFVPHEKWEYVSSELIDRNYTHWKPNEHCSDVNSSSNFPPSISKPIIFDNGIKALVISYSLVDYSSQSVLFLQKIQESWVVIDSVVTGFYIKKGTKY